MTTLPLATGTLDLEAGVLRPAEGPERSLTPQEQALLGYLVDRPHQDVARDDLLQDVLGYAPGVASRAVDDAIKRLRAKVERVPSRPFHLVGVRGVGYRFVPLATTDTASEATGHLRLGERTVDLDRLRILGPDGAQTSLSSTEGRVLEVLAAHDGRPVPTTDLLREVWEIRDIRQRRVVDKLVYRLRSKIEDDPSSPVYLRTIRGRGLLLEASTITAPRPASRRLGQPVPVPEHPLVGREGLVTRLTGALGTPGALVTLHGPAGVGKSTLARAVLHDHPAAPRLADLAEARTHLQVREALAEAFGVDLESSGPGRRLHAALADAEAPLLLVEHAEGCLDAAAEELDHARRAAPGLVVVVTSRHPLGLLGETVLPVTPLSADEARTLLQQRARSAGVALSTDDERVDALIEAVDRLPLALELAAARLRLLGLDGLVQRLGRPLDLFQRPGRGERGHHDSLREALARTWELLSDAEQDLLAATTLLGASFSIEAAEAVLGPLLDVDVLDGLQRLMDFALLRRTPSGHLALYHGVTELIREERGAALRRLAREARPRMLAWYAGLDGEPRFLYEPPPEHHATLRQELWGALSAVDRAGPSEVADVSRILCWAIPVLVRHGLLDRARTEIGRVHTLVGLPDDLRRILYSRLLLGRQALPTPDQLDLAVRVRDYAARQGDAALEACARGAWLMFAAESGQTDGAEAEAARVLELCDGLADEPAAESQGRTGVGWLAFRSGDLDLAWSELQEALGLARLAEAPWLTAVLSRDLAGVCHAEGRLHEAEAFLELSRQAVRAVEDLPWMDRSQDMLGLVRLEQGRIAEARAIHETLLDRYRQTGQRDAAARQANRLGTIEGLAGSPARAMDWFEQARAFFEAEGNDAWVAGCRYNLAECARRMDRLDEARRQFEAALALYRRIGRTVHEGLTLGAIARLDLQEGRAADAEAALRRSLPLLQAGRARRQAAEQRSVLALAVAERDLEEAWTLATEAVRELEGIGAGPPLVDTLIRQGQVALRRGDRDTTRRIVTRAADLADALGLGPASETRILLDGLAAEVDVD